MQFLLSSNISTVGIEVGVVERYSGHHKSERIYGC